MKYLTSIDLTKNELKNAAIHNLPSAPSNPVEGLVYFNTTDKLFYYYNGTAWIDVSAVDLSSVIAKATLTANTILKADEAGTPLALEVTEQTVVGRTTSGQIAAIGIDSDLSTTSANHDTIPSAKATKAYADTKQAALTFGIANGNTVVADAADIATGDIAVFTANGLEGKTTTELNIVLTSAIDTDGALAANSDSKLASQKAVKTYVDGIIAAANAMVYKGVIDASTNPNYPAANAGDVYVISVAGCIGGVSGAEVESGDMIICKTDSTATGNQATVGAEWNIVDKNNTGVVTGPASAVDDNLALFSGVTGKVVKDSGVKVADIQNKTHTGDVTGSEALTIASKAVTLAKMADLAALSIIGNDGASAGTPKALTAVEARALLNVADGATANIGTVQKFSQTIGDNSATSFVLTHNFNSRDLTVSIFEAGSPYAQVITDVQLTSLNTLTVNFAAAPTTNQYRVTITA